MTAPEHIRLALLMPSGFAGSWRDWRSWLMIPGFIAASTLGLWLLFSIWRSGRR